MIIPVSTHEQLAHLPGDILLSLALNTSAEPRGRKAAVEIMLERNYKQANHPELKPILDDVLADQAAREEIVDAVEQAIEQPIEEAEESDNPALTASVTTSNLSAPAVEDNG